MLTSLGILGVTLALALVACGEPQIRDTLVEVSPSAEPEDEPTYDKTRSRCDLLLPPEEVAELAGEGLGTAAFPPRAPSACDWGRPSNGIRVLVQQAGELGPEITDRIDAALAGGEGVTPRLRRGLLRGRSLLVAGHEVCRTLALLAETYGYPPGTTTLTYRLPDPDQPEEVGAEHCSDGRITRVEVTTDRASSDSEATVLDARQFVIRAHARGLYTG